MPTGYFDRVPKIQTHAQMEQVLAARTQPIQDAAVKPEALTERPAAPVLEWMEPIRKPDGTGNQMSRCGQFEVRKTLTEKGPTYWAWRGRRLLGYATDIQGAYDFCTASVNRDQLLEAP